MNMVWLLLILTAIVAAGYTGRMEETMKASFDSAKAAVNLAIGLIGVMALWLGLMRIAEKGGLMKMTARAIRPVAVRLFPDVPPEHPAMSAMIMNISANAIGLANAATPLGIKAMMELDKLNKEKGTATNAMCLFLAINTSNVALLPTGVMGVRAAAGASNPAAIILPTFLATLCSTIVAIFAARLLSRGSANPSVVESERDTTAKGGENPAEEASGEEALVPPGPVARIVVLLLVAAFVGSIVYAAVTSESLRAYFREFYSLWLLPVIMGGFLLFGFFRGVRVYEAATEGAREGFQTAVRIIPFLVAILVAIGMFRAGGAFEILVRIMDPVTSLIGMPAEALPMAVMRPLSGSGAFGIMSEIVNNNPDGFVSFLVSTMQGSTETTFYVLAVYFGAIGIQRTRHALPAALTADVAGVLAAVLFARLMYQ